MAADGTLTSPAVISAHAPRRVVVPGDRGGWLSAARALLRRHVLLAALLTVGAAVRLLVLVTFRPALEYLQDSYDYLLNAQHLQPGVVRPLLYPLALRGLGTAGGLGLVPVVQHLASLAMGVLLYAALCRAGARRWLAALGVAPLLLDAYQLDIEQFVLSETLFQSLIVAAVACLLWRDRPSGVLAAAAGLALAGAALTRDVGVALVAGPVVLLAVRRAGWRLLVAFGATAVVPLLAYGGWFASVHGSFGLQRYSGIMFASRAMTVADCRQVHVPAYERSLCIGLPPARRQSADWYASYPSSPLRRLRPPAGLTHEAVAADFARRVITTQPQAYARVVGGTWRTTCSGPAAPAAGMTRSRTGSSPATGSRPGGMRCGRPPTPTVTRCPRSAVPRRLSPPWPATGCTASGWRPSCGQPASRGWRATSGWLSHPARCWPAASSWPSPPGWGGCRPGCAGCGGTHCSSPAAARVCCWPPH